VKQYERSTMRNEATLRFEFLYGDVKFYAEIGAGFVFFTLGTVQVVNPF